MSSPNNIWKRAHDNWNSTDEDFWKDARFDIIPKYKNRRTRVDDDIEQYNFVIVWLKNKTHENIGFRYTYKNQDKLGFLGHISDNGLINIHYCHNGKCYITRDIDPNKNLFMDIRTGPDPNMLPGPPPEWIK